MIGESSAAVRDDLAHADFVLLCIPILFATIYGAGVLVFDARTIAIAGAALICCLLVADGLFWHAPQRT